MTTKHTHSLFRSKTLTQEALKELCNSLKAEFPHLRKATEDTIREWSGFALENSSNGEMCGVLIAPRLVESDAEFVGAVWGEKAAEAEDALLNLTTELADGLENYLMLWSADVPALTRNQNHANIEVDHVEVRMSKIYLELSASQLASLRISLKPATAADIPFLARMDNEGFEDDIGSRQVALREQFNAPKPGVETLIAYQKSDAIGKVEIATFGDSVSIFGLVVAADRRGTGLAKDIVNGSLERCGRLNGARYFWLEVDVANLAAYKTYHSTGFSDEYKTVYFRLHKK